MEDEHFIVWMRTAGLPTFRKLYAKIDTKLEKDSHYRVQIWNGYSNDPVWLESQGVGCSGTDASCNGTLYPVHTFHGDKYVVLSTTAWIGGKNQFLGIGAPPREWLRLEQGSMPVCIHSFWVEVVAFWDAPR